MTTDWQESNKRTGHKSRRRPKRSAAVACVFCCCDDDVEGDDDEAGDGWASSVRLDDDVQTTSSSCVPSFRHSSTLPSVLLPLEHCKANQLDSSVYYRSGGATACFIRSKRVRFR
ncbi:hypothetical protein L596_001527 [Steinernema carpocapsae]|uniref:Uncharacterized protein n=1 Tax=Steinernema carpocapsae TaxID=34508 RepID=A0A4U8ULT8_STECR|nr:hypothetical protein L596_001527 [Steinernema carpocapsae]